MDGNMDSKKEIDLELKKHRDKMKKHREKMENVKNGAVLDDKELKLTEELYNKLDKIIKKSNNEV